MYQKASSIISSYCSSYENTEHKLIKLCMSPENHMSLCLVNRINCTEVMPFELINWSYVLQFNTSPYYMSHLFLFKVAKTKNMARGYWGVEGLKPEFWPDIPFKCPSTNKGIYFHNYIF